MGGWILDGRATFRTGGELPGHPILFYRMQPAGCLNWAEWGLVPAEPIRQQVSSKPRLNPWSLSMLQAPPPPTLRGSWPG
jgi:hypothetical protein